MSDVSPVASPDDILIYGDTLRDANLRHVVPVPIGDPLLFADVAGKQHLVCLTFEVPRLGELQGFDVHSLDDFGLQRLADSTQSRLESYEQIFADAIEMLGVRDARVPDTFPLGLAEKLRQKSVALVPDREFFANRLRTKTPPELAGIRRAQACADATMSAIAAMLRSADIVDDRLIVAGVALTAERVKLLINDLFAERECTATYVIVSRGPQSAVLHEQGYGELRANEPIIVDLGPRDRTSGCHADITRTFVVGEPPPVIAERHSLCLDVLTDSRTHVRAGTSTRDLFDRACAAFETAGYATQRTHRAPEPLLNGFTHSLGHGVGLDIHEYPFIGLHGREVLQVGDVIAIEPGLYEGGIGGVRVEDMLVVTEDGYELLTDSSYSLAP